MATRAYNNLQKCPNQWHHPLSTKSHVGEKEVGSRGLYSISHARITGLSL